MAPKCHSFRLVRETRIELAWVAPYAPQTYASTISAIPAATCIISRSRNCRNVFLTILPHSSLLGKKVFFVSFTIVAKKATTAFQGYVFRIILNLSILKRQFFLVAIGAETNFMSVVVEGVAARKKFKSGVFIDVWKKDFRLPIFIYFR